MKHSFFQAAVMLILLYGCTTWTLTKHVEKKLDGNYKRMLQAILNKSWKQHPTKQLLYGHLPPITKTILDELDMWDTAGEVGTNSYGPLHMDKQKQDDQLELTYNSSVLIHDVDLLEAMNNREGLGRGSEISMLMA